VRHKTGTADFEPQQLPRRLAGTIYSYNGGITNRIRPVRASIGGDNSRKENEMPTLHRRLLKIALAIMFWTSVQPGTSSAQTSGVGSDGFTRLLWRGTDSSISLWKCNPALVSCVSHLYGPYAAWTPIAMTTANNNNTYILWKNTDGTATVWLVDANLNFVTSAVYGPYSGWTAESLSVSTSNNSTLRLLWTHTNGALSLWILQPNLSVPLAQNYGPYFGYKIPDAQNLMQAPADLAAGKSAGIGNAEVADAKAAAAMEVDLK
jgi:hypothetical protein